MAIISQHVGKSGLTVSIRNLYEHTYLLILEGDGVEVCVYLNKKQLEQIAGKTMAFLMPELQVAK